MLLWAHCSRIDPVSHPNHSAEMAMVCSNTSTLCTGTSSFLKIHPASFHKPGVHCSVSI
uniref:Uncharacterized protein n=1 Tax=Anguilla anguilla TaxID=7936 RepID=A0A0E9UQ65_ANGAN